MAKNLDIDSCALCKHIDYTRGQRDRYTLCLKASKVIDTNFVQNSDCITLEKIDIPNWCPLPDHVETEPTKKE